jgi:NitT/TauT family transport system ATP-binding protein
MIQIENVTKHYSDQGAVSYTILNNMNLHIPCGQFLCVLGPSGCGKTTLINLVAGFIKPSYGQLLFNSSRIIGPGPERGVVFQEATLFPWLTARGNVEFGLRQTGVNSQDRFNIADEFLRLVGMETHGDLYPHALSGGMKQRIAIARVLALKPEALLMDEPFSNLDANSRERLQDELLKIWEVHRRTLLYVTHSVDEAVYLADRVVIMGPPPTGIYDDLVLNLKRPRKRASSGFQETIASLRNILGEIPTL